MDSVQRRWRTKEILASQYRRLAAPLGRRHLRRMLEAGLPDLYRVPLGSLVGEPLDGEAAAVGRRVEELRHALSSRPESHQVVSDSLEPVIRTTSHLAAMSSMTPAWGTFLFLCARAAQARSTLELGCCSGISGSYLAANPHCERFIGIEGSESLATVAEGHIRQSRADASVVCGYFDDVLDGVLKRFENGLDLVHVDGNHYYEPTLRYTEQILPHLNTGAVIIFDDIRWSRGMWQAWEALRERPGFSNAVDAGRVGVCQWHGHDAAPQQFSLAPYTGWFRIANRPDPTSASRSG